MSEEKKEKVTDEQINVKWRQMLKTFEAIISSNPKPETVKEDLLALIGVAKTSILTPKQIDGIYGRCENYMNGSYGRTKTAANYSYAESDKASQNGKPN
jgi:hypothetical protein